ncbi:MAG TPA: diacylglycerol kinase family lipid kinase [Anaerolineales bacterium]|nr:diacylglycerol kinase family lipid kinase [Anaerolineales bacterium]
METLYKRIRVIINPAAGQPEPILNTLNTVFYPHGIDWDVRITQQSGDAQRFAKEALEQGVDLVAGYGGDGTQMEVANALMNSDTPMAILPGGTGNAMTYELNIPRVLKQAAELIVGDNQIKKIDIAKINERNFILRAYAGFDSERAASREMKDKFGQLAYVNASLNFLRETPTAQYRATIDGKVIEGKAMLCFILNAGALGGVLGIPLPEMPEVNISDGFLDFYAITTNLKAFRALSNYVLQVGESSTTHAQAGIYHWRGREITLEADPPQDVWIDGEEYGPTPITATALHQAIQVLVPKR